MGVVKDQDPFAQGKVRELLFKKVTAVQCGDSENDPMMQDYDYRNARSLDIKNLSDACTSIGQRDCFAAIENSGKTIAQWVNQEQWLLERYQTLIAYKKYEEVLGAIYSVPLRYNPKTHVTNMPIF
jgi:hypothetical protein